MQSSPFNRKLISPSRLRLTIAMLEIMESQLSIRRIELGVQKCRGAGVGTCFLANYSSKAKYLQGAKWRPMLSFRHLANICRSTYLLDTLFTKFWKNHIKLLHKFIGEMWKQQQHATTTYEIHFSSCFFFDLSYRPISRQNPEPSNLSPLVRQALLTHSF